MLQNILMEMLDIKNIAVGHVQAVVLLFKNVLNKNV